MVDSEPGENGKQKTYAELEKEIVQLESRKVATVIQKVSTSADRNGNSRSGWLVLRELEYFPRLIFVSRPDCRDAFDRMPDLKVSPSQFAKLKKGIF